MGIFHGELLNNQMVIITGWWWLEPWEFWMSFQKQLGICQSSSQLTFTHSIIFQRGRSTTNQISHSWSHLMVDWRWPGFPCFPFIQWPDSPWRMRLAIAGIAARFSHPNLSAIWRAPVSDTPTYHDLPMIFNYISSWKTVWTFFFVHDGFYP